MNIIEENNQTIEEIECLINDLKIEEMEMQLVQYVTEMKMEGESVVCDERMAFNTMNKIGLFLNRIIAVNEIIIEKNSSLSNRIQLIQNLQCFPCNISYMDIPFNSSIFVVQLFYRKLYEKYSEYIEEMISLGLTRNLTGRELNIGKLSDSERIIANELNVFALYVKAYQQLKALIDLCKNIIYNYSEME